MMEIKFYLGSFLSNITIYTDHFFDIILVLCSNILSVEYVSHIECPLWKMIFASVFNITTI
jgi:hypothetical protein